MADSERINNAVLDPGFVQNHGEGFTRGKTLMDLSVPGRVGLVAPKATVPMSELIPDRYLRKSRLRLPELSQGQIVGYFTRLSQDNISIGTGQGYFLGSCTMKYDPLIDDEVANLPGFIDLHPAQPEATIQGSLQVIYELEHGISQITGLPATSLNQLSGAHAEQVGVQVIRAYHESRNDPERKIMLIPESAHGTNPASAAMTGFEVMSLKTNKDGDVDQDDLDQKIAQYGPQIAGLMITYPSTLGLADRGILQITSKVHQAGGLVYGDGANTNAVMGWVRFGDLGIDVAHVNLHKALAVPHGGGGPGAGSLSVAQFLAEFLPGPIVVKEGDQYKLEIPKNSVGRVSKWYGNFVSLARALPYILTMGAEGLKEASSMAVLNANYVRALLKPYYHITYGADRPTMHEVVFDDLWQRAQGKVTATELAKRLEDYGFHPPTIHFPHDPKGAIMVEPTETASREAIEAFCAAMIAIAGEVRTNPEIVLKAPHLTPIRRLDETRAVRYPVLRWRPANDESGIVAATTS